MRTAFISVCLYKSGRNMQITFEFRGTPHTTRPFGLFSIAPLLKAVDPVLDSQEDLTVEIRGHAFKVNPLSPEQASQLATLLGDSSGEAIFEAMSSVEANSLITRLIRQQSNLPTEWIFWGSEDDFYTDLTVEEITTLIRLFLTSYEKIAEAMSDPKTIGTLRRIVPTLPGDLTMVEVGELITLLATEAQEHGQAPAPQVHQVRGFSPDGSMATILTFPLSAPGPRQATRIANATTGGPVMRGYSRPVLQPSPSVAIVPDEEDLGL